MLQQTQASRVVAKYLEFLQTFPDELSLATAPLSEVLRLWSGLGYNRRAQYLHQAAQQMVKEPVSNKVEDWCRLPGVGYNTAAAILNYSYNQATPFIETNIRTVYIHHYFMDQEQAINDRQLLPLVAQTMDSQRPREWFWALMDYGSHIKLKVGNVSKLSKHYTKQSPFVGSRRAVRGEVIKQLAVKPLTKKELQKRINDERLLAVLDDLAGEALICVRKQRYYLGNGD